MNYLLKHAQVWVDSSMQSFDSIYIQDGIWIEEPLENCTEIDCSSFQFYPHLTELHADFKQPGLDHVYSLEQGVEAALRGGFGTVLLSPDSSPIVDERSSIEWLKAQCASFSAEVLFSGALSKNLKGNSLPEYIEMEAAGASAISNGLRDTPSSSYLQNALAYSTQGDLRVHLLAMEEDLKGDALIASGCVADQFGLYGIPEEAETIAIYRILSMSKLSHAKVHIKHVTLPESIALIEEFREQGLDVTFDVSMYNLLYDESDLKELSSVYYFEPPLRSKEKRTQMLELLANNKIDAISTQHIPVLPEDKNTFLQGAESGSVSLEVAVSLLKTELNLSWKQLISLLSVAPRSILKKPVLELGVNKSFEAFAWLNESLLVSGDHFVGQVQNSPALHKTLDGSVIGTMIQGSWRTFRK